MGEGAGEGGLKGDCYKGFQENCSIFEDGTTVHCVAIIKKGGYGGRGRRGRKGEEG